MTGTVTRHPRSLSPAQDAAVRELLRHDGGSPVAPPGSGKTRMACAAIQDAGRILRWHGEKTAVRTYDYRDGSVPVLDRMQTRRQRTLGGVGFMIEGRRGWPLEDRSVEGLP